MGGLHCALADDADTLFSNPAGVRAVDRQFTVSGVTLNLYESAVEIAGETLFGSTPGPPRIAVAPSACGGPWLSAT